MRKGISGKSLETAALVFLLILLPVLAGKLCRANPAGEDADVVSLESGWYRLQGGEKEYLTLPVRLWAEDGEELVVYNDTLTQADAGKIFSAGGVQYGLRVQLGDQLLYFYQDNAFPKNDQMKGKLWADVQLPEETGQEPLQMIYNGTGDSWIVISAPILGSLSAVTGQHLQSAAFSLVMILGMLGLGILSLMVFFYMKNRKLTEKRILDAALFLLICSLWCLTDSGLIQSYGRNTALWSLISFYAFMLMPVPMLHFVAHTVEKSRLTGGFIAAFYINALAQGAVHLIFDIPFIDMLLVTHILMASGVAAMTGLLYQGYRKKKTRELRLCLQAFGVLGFGGVLALVLYWLFRIYWYDAIFQFGILLYIAFLLWALICQVADDVHFRLEQEIMERMAREDRMTGLRNRRAYEEYLEKLHSQIGAYQDIVLTYIHLEELKELNETYGMSAGDEAVIGAARCIENVQKAWIDEQMECFRIDGDEFAVVCLHPKAAPEEMERALQEEVKKYNSSSTAKYRICLRTGHCSLRKADGETRTFSDWKSHADESLRKSENWRGGRE